MLNINEIFGPTIQGEGKSIYKEVIFIRTAGCNLRCVWCDTPYTWNWTTAFINDLGSTYSPSLETFSKEDEIKSMTTEQVVDKVMALDVVSKSFAVVISGGEPMIQQKNLTPLIARLKDLGFWVEIETNGTILPIKEFMQLVDQINCSPKLANSRNSMGSRERVKVLKFLAQDPKTNFKFVVSNPLDVTEITTMVEKYNMKDVYLMPLGITVKQLSLVSGYVEKIAKIYGFHYTNRAHIVELGGGRGV